MIQIMCNMFCQNTPDTWLLTRSIEPQKEFSTSLNIKTQEGSIKWISIAKVSVDLLFNPSQMNTTLQIIDDTTNICSTIKTSIVGTTDLARKTNVGMKKMEPLYDKPSQTAKKELQKLISKKRG